MNKYDIDWIIRVTLCCCVQHNSGIHFNTFIPKDLN